MRIWLGIALLLLASCDGNNSTDPVENPRDKVKTLDDLSNYQDFNAQMSADGKFAVFLSRRISGTYRAFLYDETAQTKLKALSDLRPLEEGEEELSVNLGSDGKWVLVERQGPTSHKLILLNWKGQLSGEVPLSAQSQLLGVSISDEAHPYFSFAERIGSTSTVKTFRFDVSTGTVSPLAQFEGESRPLLTQNVQGETALFTLARSADRYLWKARKFDALESAWTELNVSTNLANQKDVNSPAAASARGLVFTEGLNKAKLKTKLGTYSERPAGYVADVGVLDSPKQLDAFGLGGAGTINFEAESFKAYQPLTTSNISMTPDGAYALISGNDSYFCKTRLLPVNYFQLLRISDMVTIPLFVARAPGESNPPWTELLTDLCAIYDAEAPQLELDGAIYTASLAAGDGSSFRVVYESQRGGEKEVYRATFKVDDWAQKKLSEVSIVNLSKNKRP